MTDNSEKAMSGETVIERPRYLASELRGDILDLLDWAKEDGLEWWEIYGVISSIEKQVELFMKADMMTQAKESEDEDENQTN